MKLRATMKIEVPIDSDEVERTRKRIHEEYGIQIKNRSLKHILADVVEIVLNSNLQYDDIPVQVAGVRIERTY